MKIKTSELTGAALDWAVAILECPKGTYGGEVEHYSGNKTERWIRIPDKKNRTYVLARYSTDWAQGGPIIEREKITTAFDYDYYEERWAADKLIDAGADFHNGLGSTPLIAAIKALLRSVKVR